MSHFGVLSYKGTGHLNPLIALSRRLIARGHRVTFFQKPELEARVRQCGIEFSAIGSAKRSEEQSYTDNQCRPTSAIAALRYDIRRILGNIEVSLRDTPDALTQARVDALIVDEIVLSGPTLAQMLHLPYFVVSTSMPHTLGWTASYRFAGYNVPNSYFDQLRGALLQLSVFRLRGPVRWKLDSYRRHLGLGPIREIQKEFPALAHLAQLPRCLDFPRSMLPNNFYYTGPFVDATARPCVKFPWSRLDHRSLIYASLGTARKTQPNIFHLISEACNDLNLQLVISLGGRGNPENFDDLPGFPVVVRDAPQLELIKRAEIVISHGGLNTVLETLLEGKPMITIPIAYDQPAVAARLGWLKVADVLPVRNVSAEQIRLALSKLLNDTSYRDAARELQARILSDRGLERAVAIIEDAHDKYTGNYDASKHLNDRIMTSR